MNKTKIEWVKNPDGTQGYTWNPITGCLNGCSYCYARKLANGRLKSMYLANKNVAPRKIRTHVVAGQHYEWPDDIPDINPFYPRFWEDRFRDFGYPNAYGVQKVLRPKGIFPCDMSDLFGIGIPEDWTRLVMEYIRDYPEHRFYLLTKQYQNLSNFSPFPPNCWVGGTVCANGDMTRFLTEIKHIKATVKYISFEPLLEEVINQSKHHGFCNLLSYYRINWVIIGAQTKPYKPPKISWVEEIVRACDKAGIPVFLKDNLVRILPAREPFHTVTPLSQGGFAYKFPRQEVPKL